MAMSIPILRILQWLLAIPAFFLVFVLVVTLLGLVLDRDIFRAAQVGSGVVLSAWGLAGIACLIGIQVIEVRIKRLRSQGPPPAQPATPQ